MYAECRDTLFAVPTFDFCLKVAIPKARKEREIIEMCVALVSALSDLCVQQKGSILMESQIESTIAQYV